MERERARAQLEANSVEPPRVVDAARVVRALKLVTVEIDTTVRSGAVHESWRGDVAAAVDAPVRYFYGADLSSIGDGAVTRNPVTRAVTVRIPPPRRLAVEVFTERETTSVDIGWGRLRDRAGEYYLGRARSALHERAREAPLSEEDEARVRRMTVEQVLALLREVLEPGADVRVVMDDGLGGDAAAEKELTSGEGGGDAAGDAP